MPKLCGYGLEAPAQYKCLAQASAAVPMCSQPQLQYGWFPEFWKGREPDVEAATRWLAELGRMGANR